MKILQQKLFKVIVPRSIKLIFINNKELIPKKLPFFRDSSLGILYTVLWFNVCNKELLALMNNFRVTKKFLIAKFDCIRVAFSVSKHHIVIWQLKLISLLISNFMFRIKFVLNYSIQEIVAQKLKMFKSIHAIWSYKHHGKFSSTSGPYIVFSDHSE